MAKMDNVQAIMVVAAKLPDEDIARLAPLMREFLGKHVPCPCPATQPVATPEVEAEVKKLEKGDTRKPRTAKRGGSKGRSTPYCPLWFKVVTSVDTSKKGMYAIDGDWVWCNKLNDVPDGKLVVVGTKKKDGFESGYWLCVAQSGRSVEVEFKHQSGDERTFSLDGVAFSAGSLPTPRPSRDVVADAASMMGV